MKKLLLLLIVLVSASVAKAQSTSLEAYLLSFEAVNENGAARISWSTGVEYNNDTYTVESSRDGIRFSVVAVKKVEENSPVQHDYVVYDHPSSSGTIYYRLKKTDLDGSMSYSHMISIEWQVAELGAVFPNPTAGFQVSLLLSSAATVVITGPTGRVVFQKEYESEGQYTLDIDAIKTTHNSGLYHLVFSSSEAVSTKTLIIQ
jgi:hypothetical protein